MKQADGVIYLHGAPGGPLELQLFGDPAGDGGARFHAPDRSTFAPDLAFGAYIDRLAEDIESMELGSKERTRAERDLISRSVMVEVDPDGRIVLPPRVREKMGFAGDLPGEAEAAFAGFTNRFRLYRREVYDAELAEDEDDDIDPLTLVGRHKRTG